MVGVSRQREEIVIHLSPSLSLSRSVRQREIFPICESKIVSLEYMRWSGQKGSTLLFGARFVALDEANYL